MKSERNQIGNIFKSDRNQIGNIFIKEKRLKDNGFFIPFCALSEAKGMCIKMEAFPISS